jgi:hypothetical protein
VWGVCGGGGYLELLQFVFGDEGEEDVALNGGSGSPVAVTIGDVGEGHVVICGDASGWNASARPVVTILKKRRFDDFLFPSNRFIPSHFHFRPPAVTILEKKAPRQCCPLQNPIQSFPIPSLPPSPPPPAVVTILKNKALRQISSPSKTNKLIPCQFHLHPPVVSILKERRFVDFLVPLNQFKTFHFHLHPPVVYIQEKMALRRFCSPINSVHAFPILYPHPPAHPGMPC